MDRFIPSLFLISRTDARLKGSLHKQKQQFWLLLGRTFGHLDLCKISIHTNNRSQGGVYPKLITLYLSFCYVSIYVFRRSNSIDLETPSPPFSCILCYHVEFTQKKENIFCWVCCQREAVCYKNVALPSPLLFVHYICCWSFRNNILFQNKKYKYDTTLTHKKTLTLLDKI